MHYLESNRLVFKRVTAFLDENLRLSKSGFLLFSPVSILAVPLTISAYSSSNPWVIGTFIGVLLSLITYIPYALAIVFLQKKVELKRWKVNILVTSVTGLFRGAVFYFLLQVFEIPQPSPFFQRLFNSTFITLVWLTIANIAIEVNRRYKRRYRAILSQLMIVSVRNGDGSNSGFSSISEELSLLQQGLRETYSEAERSIEKNTAMRKVAEDLHSHIESALKPMSRRLWVTSSYKFPQLKFWRLIIDAIGQLKYPTFTVASTLAASGLILLAPQLGLSFAIISSISGFIFFHLTEFTRTLIVKKFNSYEKLVNFIFVFSVGLITSAFATVVLRIYDGSGSFTLGVILSPYTSILIIAASAINLALSDRRLIIENLIKEVRELSQTSMFSFQNSQAASYIHNSLQSELTALAHEFEKVAESPEGGRSEALMEKLDALIRRSIAEDFANFLESPAERLERVLNSWSQIITLTTEIDMELFKDSARGNLFVQLIEESLANSVRKGKASKVTIVATLTDNQLRVEIIDNGTFDESPTPGMGSAWIERHSVGDWSFETSNVGTTLRVEL